MNGSRNAYILPTSKRLRKHTLLKVNKYSPDKAAAVDAFWRGSSFGARRALCEATGQADLQLELVELWTLKKVDLKKGLSVWAKP